jgi:hypothetical protein|tara:strand:+ start:223 stop:561 length:339 start_codon:yes stop_codon:yes gene_type:complete
MTKTIQKEKTTKKEETTQNEKTIVGIVWLQPYATSYCIGKNEKNIITATRTAKYTKRYWKHQFKFPKNTIITVYLYDLTECGDKWGYEYGGYVYDEETKKQMPFLEKLEVVV